MPHPSTSPTWVIGTFVFLSGSFLNFGSYAFAPQSMLASLESIQFVTNILFGKFLLKAKVTGKMYAGTALTVFGTVIAVLFSSSSKSTDMTIDKLFNLWLEPAYLFYLFLMGCAIVLISTVYKSFEVAEKNEIPLPYT